MEPNPTKLGQVARESVPQRGSVWVDASPGFLPHTLRQPTRYRVVVLLWPQSLEKFCQKKQ
jgi:hypothetical protein